MDLDAVPDEELENVVLKYIDCPYFKNNPLYISLWERYYSICKSPAVLFLMRYKKISQYYHWIYLELSRYFKSTGRSWMCRHVILMGMHCNAHDASVLQKEMDSVPEDDCRHSENDINALMNPKGFFVFGKAWNAYEERLSYNRMLFTCGEEEMSFEEFRARAHIRNEERAQIELEDGWVHFGYACNEDERKDGVAVSDLQMSIGHVDAKVDLQVGSTLVVEGCAYYIKSMVNKYAYEVVCLHKDAAHVLQMNKTAYVLQEVFGPEISAIREIVFEYAPVISIKSMDDRYFAVYERCFGTLKTCLDVLWNTYPSVVVYHAHQVIEMLKKLAETGKTFLGFSLESVQVSARYTLEIVDFKMQDIGDAPSGIDALWKNAAIELLQMYGHGHLCTDESEIGHRIQECVGKMDVLRMIRKCKILLHERSMSMHDG
ncbi:putative Mad3/BUB1 like region 1 protein [Ordospora pajunii]|uniref:putative Mad3/BUB1 like region 1 protein n=1 Tax=Ordospora pajunii TaxID=3039483 RepID=UPI0029526581|nr:putative Mad3/BUB1 like region 1 protein [Ordospora pajunii]KAH9411673.1 putative Mad3/BUB1 like region 1 protein [Ordospora pajunii]